MCLTWPDPVSFLADIVTILGVPLLFVANRALYREVKKAHQLKGVGEDCLIFHDVNGKCAINLAPYGNSAVVPGKGDVVTLPGETSEAKNYGGGRYEVVSVEFHYRQDRKSDRPCPATLITIEVNVKKLADFSENSA
jgi:hypothetical protein